MHPLDTIAPAHRDLERVRARTLGLVAHLGCADLERQIAPIMSPLVWDLAHIASYEDLWIARRQADLELLRPDLAAMYDAFETPRAVRAGLPLLDADAALAYLAAVRNRALEVVEDGRCDELVLETVVRHELQHTETMLQAMALAGLLPLAPAPGPLSGVEGWVAFDAGSHELGAGEEGFAYDNERPRHEVEVAPFLIARRPVTNASWLRFAEGGGYARREWWSREGWAWKEQYDVTRHDGAAYGDAEAAVCCVSWFEAEAFAAAAGARLPSEAEWERAAASGSLSAVGAAWEWTTSWFTGYPGFVARPYREYSEVFFGASHRVLRGGSWATDRRVAGLTFRNWELPERRQLFAGVRLVRDPAAA